MKISHFLLIILTGLLVAWLSGLVIFSIAPLRPQEPPAHVDSIIVLTGGPGRIEKGLEFFAGGTSKYLFISGIHPDVIRKEIIAKWQGKNPLPACCMILGRKATTTRENAQETKEWVEKQNINSVLLITSDYHMSRAKLEIQSALPALEIYPYPVSGYLPQEKRARLFFSEYNKTLYRIAQIFLNNITKPQP